MAGQPVQAETAPPENIADTTDDGSRLYAVYCTVEIPLTTVARFITLSRAAAGLDTTVPCDFPCIITSASAPFVSYTRSTRLPLTLPASLTTRTSSGDAFASPFVGWDLHQVRQTFCAQVRGLPSTHHAVRGFVILDERSAREETCLVACYVPEMQTLRTDFHTAIECLVAPEIGLFDFGEGTYADFYRAKETVTREKLQAQQQRWEREGLAKYVQL